MLENGKMGCLRRVFEVILGHNVINRHFLRGIYRRLFWVICGHFFSVTIRGCLFNVINSDEKVIHREI